MNKIGWHWRFLNPAPFWGPGPRPWPFDSWSLFHLARLVFFSAVIPAGVAFAGSFQPRVQIPGAIQVESEALKLSDLLPPDAPGEVIDVCRRVLLGNAPLPSSLRVVSRVQIADSLRDFPSTLEQLEMPDRVIVTRKRRRLSTAEILTAIETSLSKESRHGLQMSKLEGLYLQAPVYVTKADPGLRVKRLEPDRVERKTRFLLWTSKEPGMLPFYVTVEGLPERMGWSAGSPLLLGGDSARGTASSSELPQRVTLSPAVLVTRGEPAKLVFETATLRMTALVTPLESGVQGQIIRVRNQDTHRELKAEVIGKGLLEAEAEGE